MQDINKSISPEVNAIVNVSGGMECFAALWWAKEKKLRPVALHLYNEQDNPTWVQAQLFYAKKQCEYFKIPLIVDINTIPQKKKVPHAVIQHISACAALIGGNPDNKWEYIVWGANADDSFQQRLLLRYPIRAILAQKSFTLDLHGIDANTFIHKMPTNIFPFETLSKSEIIAMLAKNHWEFVKDNTWSCARPDLHGGIIKEVKDAKGEVIKYVRCGKCTKCVEYDYNRQVANKSVFKLQEGIFPRHKPYQREL